MTVESRHVCACEGTAKRGNLKLVENKQERFVCDFGCLYVKRRIDNHCREIGLLLYNGDFGNRWHLTTIVGFREEILFIPDDVGLHIHEDFHRKSYNNIDNEMVEYFKPDSEYLKKIFSYRLSRIHNNGYIFIKDYLKNLRPCFLKEDERNKMLVAVEKLPEF